MKNFSNFLNEDFDTESNKKFILANIKGGNDKIVREVFAWYIEHICDNDDDITLIAGAFKNKSKEIK